MSADVWKISVFCQNESRRIVACLESVKAAIAAGHPQACTITVKVNGSADDSAALARSVNPLPGVPILVAESQAADKSNAINEEIYAPDAGAGMHVFIDGYVTINSGALIALRMALTENPQALAASGVAGNGRSEVKSRQATLRGGVMHGQLYALTRKFEQAMTAAGFRLPVGLYRGDGLLGSMAAMALDPVHQQWNDSRMIGVGGAEFMIDQLSLFRPADLRRQFRRKIRQMRGRIENAAIKSIVHRSGYGALPGNADAMIADYLKTNPVPKVGLPDRPFMALALRQHRQALGRA